VSRLRGVAKLLCAGVANLCFFLYVVVGGSIVSSWDRLHGRPGGAGWWRTRVFHGWGRALARLLGMRVRILGKPPEPPFVLVSNHLGYVDVILLASVLRCVFVSKADVKDWPVVGRLCRAVDTLFIQREQKRDIPRVMREMDQVLASGRGIVVFPEGTSSGGGRVLPFRAPLLDSAVRAGRPVHYATLSYATLPGDRPAGEIVCWWGNMPLVPHVFNLLTLRGFEATIAFGDRPILEADRKILASRLEREVERQFQTVI